MTLASVKHIALHQIQRLYITETLPAPQQRKLGLIYCIYRFIVSGFLLIASYVSIDISGSHALPSLLQQTALSFYLLLSLILLGLLYFVAKHPQHQLAAGLTIDVIILSLLLYTSGAPDLQLTMLYMVVVAASFMLLNAAQALVITLMAIIFVIYQQFFFAIANSLSFANLGDALLMSASFLAVGFLSWTISQRLVQMEKTAAIQAQEVSRLNAINQEVISKMISGVLVVDNQKVVLANQAACQLLHINAYFKDDEQSLELLQHQLDSLHTDLCDWYLSLQTAANAVHEARSTNIPNRTGIDNPRVSATADNHTYPFTFIYELPAFASNSGVDKLRVELTPLKNNSQLLILEDLRREQASAQQLKLASLGQLTASIAHEIRNPLAAISQASQLLIEDVAEQQAVHTDEFQYEDSSASHGATDGDDNHELYQMIFSQTKRVNRIIEDVIKLSRQEKPKRKAIDIAKWLRQFLSDHFESHNITLQLQAVPTIYFDPHQLEQILINLINNGLRYSRRSNGGVEVHLYCIDNDVIIDIIDDGAGVKPGDLARLFDPFFTTDPQGTGLGLYLSQAFSEANHARLLCVPEHEKTCFRLIIPLHYRPVSEFLDSIA